MEHAHALPGFGTGDGPVDPVCGMNVSPDSPHVAEHAGKRYHFCCDGCQSRFVEEPERYLNAPAPRPLARPRATSASAPPAGDDRTYTCPMHPEVRQKGPGSCPICGMALEPELPRLDDGPSPEQLDFERRLRISAVLSAPLVLLSMGEMFAPHALPAGALPWIGLALSTPVVLWAGGPLFARGGASIVNRSPNMFTLVALGIGTAYGYSVAATVAPGLFPDEFRAHGAVGVYFEAAAVITTLVLLGQVLELRARARAGDAIRALIGLQPTTARKVRPNGMEVDIPLANVHVGDRLRVRGGERVPVDGVVLEGTSFVDESMVTGEAMPVQKGPRDAVTGGTLNGTGSFVFRAEKVGSDTLLSRIVAMVAEAQRSKAPIQRLADRVSEWFVPAVVGAAAITFVAWAVFGPREAPLAFALVNAISVLIIACPCALGLATPISVVVAAGRGAGAGVLVRDAVSFEHLARVDTLLVDKTGTLTEGRPVLVDVLPGAGRAAGDVVRWAAAVEKASEHPLGAAIVAGAIERGLVVGTATDYRGLTGRGAEGRVDGHTVAVGSERLLEELGVDATPVAGLAAPLRADGKTAVFVVVDGQAAGVLAIHDPIKASAADALAALRAEGLRIVMVTGDERATAEAVAKRLGIAEVHAGVLPDEKRAVVEALKGAGRVVAMAGDGINDAPALAAADVGIAMGTGTDVAMQSAGITLVKGDLRGIVRARRLSRATLRNIRQNLFFAFVYNIAGVPLAAGVLYPFFGLLLSPMIASAAMSFSSVSVIANALRLRTVRL